MALETERTSEGCPGRLGHATISTTLDLYSHVAPGLQKAAAARLDELLTRLPRKWLQTRPVSNPLAKQEKALVCIASTRAFLAAKVGGAGGIRTPYLCDANATFSRVNYGPASTIIG